MTDWPTRDTFTDMPESFHKRYQMVPFQGGTLDGVARLCMINDGRPPDTYNRIVPRDETWMLVEDENDEWLYVLESSDGG